MRRGGVFEDRPRLVTATMLAIVALVVGVLWWQSNQSRATSLATPGWQGGANGCPTDPLAHVPMPNSLEVIARCATVSGTVRRIKVDPVSLNVEILAEPDASDAAYVDPGIQRYLIIKVIPTDQPAVALPQIDEHASFDGAWVINRRASSPGTRELHPAWLIRAGTPTRVAAARNVLDVGLVAPPRVVVGSPLRLSVTVKSSATATARPLSEARVYVEIRASDGSPSRWAASLTDTFGGATFNLASLERPSTYTVWVHASKGRDYGIAQATTQIVRK